MKIKLKRIPAPLDNELMLDPECSDVSRTSLVEKLKRGPAPGGSLRTGGPAGMLGVSPATPGERTHGRIVLKNRNAPDGTNRQMIPEDLYRGGSDVVPVAPIQTNNVRNQKYEDKLAKIASLMIKL